jgi:4'-phosphopantetheinyl transferase
MLYVLYHDHREFNENDYYKELRLLPFFLQKEISKYYLFNDKKIRLIGKLLLRKAIIDTGYPISHLEEFERDANNKPHIKKWKSFNISHSGNFVVLCFSDDSLVGIDIEKKDYTVDIESLCSFFCDTEIRMIKQASNKIDFFYNIWVRKEAVLKAIGIGIVDGLNKFHCIFDKVETMHGNWFLRKILLEENYITYLASNSIIEEVNIMKVNRKCLLS